MYMIDMKVICLFFCLISTNAAYAFEKMSIDLGASKDSINISRLGLQKDFKHKWMESRRGSLTGYHEVSLSYWEHENESIKGIAYSPVFTFEFSTNKNISPYVEAGTGIAYLSKKTIRDRDLSSHFHFESRIGIGVKLGKLKNHELNFGYMHYSNAGIKQPNDGIDIFKFSYTFIY